MDVVQDLRDAAWTGVGAVATAFAVIVALGALIVDRRGRDADQRVAQARTVSGWVTGTRSGRPETPYGSAIPGNTATTVVNSSTEPVYGVIVWLVIYPAPLTGEELVPRVDMPPATIGVLPPGRYRVHLPEFAAGMHRRPMVEIAFTDSAGRHWVRRWDGRLASLSRTPREHYGLPEPQNWEIIPPIELDD